MSESTPPGPLIGSGRDCDVFDVGDGKVLRRSRGGRSSVTEALTMQHLHRHGYPVPEVFDVSGPDLVMERINGPTMLDAFGRRPWRLVAWAKMLADLTTRLATMPFPDHGLPAVGDRSDVIVHLDLHPLNVMLAANGPVVIDWTNASLGPRGLDTADAWLLIAAADIDGLVVQRLATAVVRRLFLRSYLARSDTLTARTMLRSAFDIRSSDPNMHPKELALMSAIVEATGTPRSG